MANVQAFAPDPGSVDIPVDSMAALVRDTGTVSFIESLLLFCRRSVGADFVSIFSRSAAGAPLLVGTATTTGPDNTRRASEGYMQHYASDVNFALMSRSDRGARLPASTGRSPRCWRDTPCPIRPSSPAGNTPSSAGRRAPERSLRCWRDRSFSRRESPWRDPPAAAPGAGRRP